jgi:hypothetical protein
VDALLFKRRRLNLSFLQCSPSLRGPEHQWRLLSSALSPYQFTSAEYRT